MSPTEERRSMELAEWLARLHRSGRPVLLTYKAAHLFLNEEEPEGWSQGHTVWVKTRAMLAGPVSIEGREDVHLDWFIVSEREREPGEGFWSAPGRPTPSEWRALFSSATVIGLPGSLVGKDR